MNGKELRSFSQDLSRYLQIDKFRSFVYIHCKAVKVSQNDQIQM